MVAILNGSVFLRFRIICISYRADIVTDSFQIRLKSDSFAAVGGERGEGATGAPSHCPPDSVPQTSAEGSPPSALPLLMITGLFLMAREALVEPAQRRTQSIEQRPQRSVLPDVPGF